MKWFKSFVFVMILMLVMASFVEAKSFSSGSRSSFSSSKSFSSSSKSFSSSSSKSFSSSSKSSSPTKAFSSSTSKSKVSPMLASGSSKIDSSKVKFTDKSTFKTLSSTKIRPRSNYVPTTYGTYSRNYYSNSGGFNTNWLMYYMIIDSMSDAAVMTAMANRDGFDQWKANATASNPALLARVNELEAKMATMNATNATSNSTYIAPEIEAQLKQAVEGAEVVDDSDMSTFDWFLVGCLAAFLSFGSFMVMRRL